MPHRLRLTKNAQFYQAKVGVTSELIAAIFAEATSNREEGEAEIINVSRVERNSTSGVQYLLSATVFPSSRDVYFVNEDVHDRIFAFMAIMEFGDYIAVFRKSCANVNDSIDGSFSLISGSQLASTFDDDLVEYQKIALRNMTVSDRAMRARSYEAVDLKGLFSTHAAGRSIPYFLKIRDGGTLKTFSASSGRLVETSDRKEIDEIADWAYEQILKLQNPSANKAFLDSFARLANLDDVLANSAPCALLVETGSFYEKIRSDELELLYQTRSKKKVRLSEPRIQMLMAAMEKVFEIDQALKIIGLDKGARIRKNAKSLTLHSPLLKKIVAQEYGQSCSLQKYLIKNGLYSICFTEPKYMYFMGRCFEDASGVAEIDSILDLLVPQAAMNGLSSEKGEFSPSITSFSPGSVFEAIEQIHASDDYIFCDDLGNEWADHICLNKASSCISFIHSKHGNSTVSASRMHEVVGQGVKNLGHMFFSKTQILKKLNDKFNDNYRGDGVETSISRIRKGNVADLDKDIASLNADFKLHRKCILACSFLSKQEVSAEFAKIKAGLVVPGYIIQLLWIISSFAHAAKDANVIPLIYCRD